MVRSKKYVTQSTTLRRSKHPSPAVATSQTKPDTANKNPTEGDLLKRLKQQIKQIEERHDRARWLGRPRIHTALFEDVAKDEEHANPAAKFGAKFAGSRVAERARKLNDLMSTL